MTSKTQIIGVYLIQNTVTGAFYVGSSATAGMRLQRHFWCLRKGNHPNRELQAQWDAYGPGAMAFGLIISCFTLKAAIDYEQQILDEHLGTAQCLNLSPQASTPVGKHRRGKGRKPVRTPEDIRAYKAAWWRRKHGAESRKVLA